jgi:hypothetical protein
MTVWALVQQGDSTKWLTMYGALYKNKTSFCTLQITSVTVFGKVQNAIRYISQSSYVLNEIIIVSYQL